MQKPVNVGIIGLGFMGTTHLDIYRQSGKAVITAIADVDPAKRKGDIRTVIGNISGGDNTRRLDLNNVQIYTDGMQLIGDPAVDLVDICVPVHLHTQYALAALAAGKHVLCEKPLARCSRDADRITAAARQAKAKFMTGMCIRFWPEYRHACDFITSGQAGAIRSATFKRVSPDINGNGWENWFMNAGLSGGAILDLHLHDVDFIRALMGMPRTVTAFGARGIRSNGGIDHVMARFDFGDGALVTAEGGWAPAKGTPFEMSFQIVCDNTTLRLAADGYSLIHEDGRVERPQPSTARHPTGWHVEIDHLLDCILNDTPPQVPLNEVVDSIRLVEAEMESIENNKTIVIADNDRNPQHV